MLWQISNLYIPVTRRTGTLSLFLSLSLTHTLSLTLSLTHTLSPSHSLSLSLSPAINTAFSVKYIFYIYWNVRSLNLNQKLYNCNLHLKLTFNMFTWKCWGLSYNTVGIFDPKYILLHYKFIFSATSFVKSFLVVLLIVIYSLFSRLPLSPVPGISFQYRFLNSLTSYPLQMSRSFKSSLFYYLNIFILKLYNFSNFKVPNYALSWFPWCSPTKMRLSGQ